MSETKIKIAELFLEGDKYYKSLQRHIDYNIKLDEASNIQEINNIEKEMEMLYISDPKSLLTKEEYATSLKEMSEKYVDLVANSNGEIKDIVFQVKAFDPLTTAKLDKITEDLLIDNPKIKKIYGSEFTGHSSFHSDNVYVMPISELDDFLEIIKDPNNNLKCVENPFLFVNHLNQDITVDDMKKTLIEKYKNKNIESFFSKNLGLYVCPMEVGKTKGHRYPEIARALNDNFSGNVGAINKGLKYTKTGDLVTVVKESRKLVDSKKEYQKDQELKRKNENKSKLKFS